MNNDELLKKAQTSFQNGRVEEARALAKKRSTKSEINAALHLCWADLLEELELFDEVIMELNLAIRDSPEDTGTYRRLSDVLLDQGFPDRAVRCISALIKKEPKNAAHYKELGNILEETGDYGKALNIYKSGYETTGDESIKAMIRSLDFLGAEEPRDEPFEKADQIIPAQHNLVTFTTLFAGREGVYARQWASPTGEIGYTPVHEPFTLKAAENHILGNMTIGVYPVRLDNTVNFIAFDIDLPKFVVRKSITRKSLWEKAMAKAHSAACKLVDLGAAHEIPIYIEDSGFKGRHCWIFLEAPVPAGVARKFGTMFLNQVPNVGPDLSIEVFPKQGRLKQGSLGNLIKLPLGFHKKTGKRSLFMRPDCEPEANQLGFLDTASRASRRSIYAFIQKFHQKPEIGVQETPPPEEQEEKREWKPVEKKIDEYDLERDRQFQYLLMKCPALRQIVERINREASVTKEETLVLIHTIGHLDHGPEAVNHLFERCTNADPSLFLKSKLKGNPVSCPKIRMRIPRITSAVSCNCVFDPSINLYPTPLIHVYTMDSEMLSSPVGLTVDSMQFQNLLQEYLKLRTQAREISLLLGKYEKQLNDFFESAGIESVQTQMGTLERRKSEEGGVSFSLIMD